MPSEPSDETTPHGFHAGVALVHRAQDSDNWRPVVDWLVRHPECAAEIAGFMSGEAEIGRAVSPVQKSYSDLAGATIGGFEVREVIGTGGAGVVFRAHDPKLNRDVALKVVRTSAASPAELARFRFEAAVVAALDHPNIVPVLSFDGDGAVPYLVMPLMTGGSLDAWLKGLGPDRCLEPKKAAEIVRDIARGVHHAHQRGLIHRDLKPGNILLDRDRVPHVADFGLARQLDVKESASGNIAGTFAYMAPEQARGDKVLTVAVDVHALGAILFELLTGRTPFGAGGASVLQRVIADPAPPVRQFRPDVSKDLEAVCLKCLSKDPEYRYPSAQSLADDLTKFLPGEPLDDRRGWVWGAVARAMGRRRETLAMGSWRVAFWGAASTFLAMAVMQAAILLGAPLWVSQAAVAYYLLAWLGLMWGFLVARRDVLNPVERASTAIHFGAKFACLGVLPVHLWLHDGNPVYALPSFMAIVGLAVFAHGVTYWGRFYLVGSAFFLTAAAMPLAPVAYWPGVYGLLLGFLQFAAGFHLRRVHKDAEAARRAGSDPSTG